jgi:hypothetical protein
MSGVYRINKKVCKIVFPFKCTYDVASKNQRVFLVLGVKQFSTKPAKGNDYFDSISNVLSKVGSYPIDLKTDVDNIALTRKKTDGQKIQNWTVTIPLPISRAIAISR